MLRLGELSPLHHGAAQPIILYYHYCTSTAALTAALTAACPILPCPDYSSSSLLFAATPNLSPLPPPKKDAPSQYCCCIRQYRGGCRLEVLYSYPSLLLLLLLLLPCYSHVVWLSLTRLRRPILD